MYSLKTRNILALVLLGVVSGSVQDTSESKKVARQVGFGGGNAVGEDHDTSESGGSGGGGGGGIDSKYYMYGPLQYELGHVCEDPDQWEEKFERRDQHVVQGKYFLSLSLYRYAQVPDHDKYEFGYRRGNDHHFREHHEKAEPKAGHFKTKVRWGDKKGGYGEHYWDYNHGDHHDDHHGYGGEGFGGSEPVPSYEQAESRVKGELDTSSSEDIKKIIPESKPVVKKEPRLSFDLDSGLVYDEDSGKAYRLKPV